MNAFPPDSKFKYEWRSYQHKVLSELDRHLANRHLHLIAPPGSGKTVLGLEVVRRLNQPTLILAPTLTIKNQWCERFVTLFLNRSDTPDWISTDLKNPKFLTIATYQALHRLFAETDASGEPANVSPYPFKTLVLDEAHHLRTEWWKSLLQFRSGLDGPNIVALTATPPYDVTPAEWDRYIELCGPVDMEISVPELVKERDLCPHQDYIYFSMPTQEERESLLAFRENVQRMRSLLLEDESFVTLLEQHPWITRAEDHLEAILSSPSYFSSMLIFLKQAGSPAWRDLSPLLGTGESSVPELSLEWMEELLTGCLYQDGHLRQEHEILPAIKIELNRIGAIERKKVCLRSTKSLDRILVNSVSKLRSITDIVRFEADTLKEDLRLVILTDFIRLSDLPKNTEDEQPLNRLGVIPIFEKLRRENRQGLKLGVLSGSIAILPAAAVPSLMSAAGSAWKNRIQHASLANDPGYVSLQMGAGAEQQLVRLVTELFTAGEIQVLIGTTALLGEGWDAPGINSLILASYVGSFMLSNQMRGRAIRVQRGNEEKTANIWHLVCVDPSHNERGYDMETLSRRFQTFVGVSFHEPVVVNGMDRMGLEPLPFDEAKIGRMNRRMLEFAGRRQELRERWNAAVNRYDSGEMVEELRAAPAALPRGFVLQTTLRALFVQGATLGLSIFAALLQGLERLRGTTFKALLVWISVAFSVGVLAALPKTVKALRLWLRHGSVESSMKQIGLAVLHTLHGMKLVQTDLEKIEIKAEQDRSGWVYCWMEGGTTYEKTMFMDTLQELLNPIENPRYLLLRQSKWGPVKRTDYHAVPGLIGRTKESAEAFHKQWERRMGQADLLFTRTVEGRKQLLKARMHSLSSAFIEKADRISAWR